MNEHELLAVRIQIPNFGKFPVVYDARPRRIALVEARAFDFCGLAGHPAEGLDLAVGVEAVDAPVAAQTAHLESAERGVDVGRH